MDLRDQFKQCLAEKKLKTTQQRTVILEAFLSQQQHLSTEELYLQIREDHPRIGYATVYRTLKLFAECGIAEERHFGDGQARYEPSHDQEHHDHLICSICGTILEFEDSEIERLQRKIAADHGFTLQSHRLDLYGVCSSCQKDQPVSG